MGTLDQPTGSTTKRKIKIIDLTGLSIAQIENQYNNNYGEKGWRIIQVVALGNKNYLIGEKEITE